MLSFGSSPLPSPLFRHQVVSLSQSACVSLVELTDRRGGQGAISYNREKAWPSIKYSILSDICDNVEQAQNKYKCYTLCQCYKTGGEL
jgi:hypothetical protein